MQTESNIEVLKGYNVKRLVTACPFCLQMFDDAIKARETEESLKVKGIDELVAESGLYRPYRQV
jgi:Fe-S oxidoreductase